MPKRIQLWVAGCLLLAANLFGQTPPPAGAPGTNPPALPGLPPLPNAPIPSRRIAPPPSPAPVPIPQNLPAPAPHPAVPPVQVVTNPPGSPLQPMVGNALVWDNMNKEAKAPSGTNAIQVVFYATNVSPNEVSIVSTRTSCGCTVAQLPSIPYRIPPGTNGEIKVTMDLRGKFGTVIKTITVTTTNAGTYILSIKVKLPDPILQGLVAMSPEQRARNQELSKVDRQAVFRGDCARCHFNPAAGKMGKELYAATCGVCHDAIHRATMVPDLRNPKRPADRNYWLDWVMVGKNNSLMPGHSQVYGGPLDNAQVFSLVEYLAGPFQSEPTANAPAAK